MVLFLANTNKERDMEFNGYNFKAEWTITSFQAHMSEYDSPVFKGDNFQIKLALHNNNSSSDSRIAISLGIVSIPADVCLTYSLLICNKDSKKSIRVNDNEIITVEKSEIQIPINIQSKDITSESGYLQNGALQIDVFFKPETLNSIPSQQGQNALEYSTDWFIDTIICDFHATQDPLQLIINKKPLIFALLLENTEDDSYSLSICLIDPEISFEGEIEIKLHNHKNSFNSITKSKKVKFDPEKTEIEPFIFDIKKEEFSKASKGWILYDDHTKDIEKGVHFTITFKKQENNDNDIKSRIIESIQKFQIKNVKYLKSEQPLRAQMNGYGFFNIDLKYPNDSDFDEPICSEFYHAGEVVIQFVLDLVQEKLFLKINDSLSKDGKIDIILIFFNSDPCLSDVQKLDVHYSASSDEEISFDLPFSDEDLEDNEKGWMINDSLNIKFQINGSDFDRQWIDNYVYPIFEAENESGFYGFEFFVPISLFVKNGNSVMLHPIVIGSLNVLLCLRYDVIQSLNRLNIKPKLSIKTNDNSVLHMLITVKNKDPQKTISYELNDASTCEKNLSKFSVRKSNINNGFFYKTDSNKKNLKVCIRFYYTVSQGSLSFDPNQIAVDSKASKEEDKDKAGSDKEDKEKSNKENKNESDNNKEEGKDNKNESDSDKEEDKDNKDGSDSDKEEDKEKKGKKYESDSGKEEEKSDDGKKKNLKKKPKKKVSQKKLRKFKRKPKKLLKKGKSKSNKESDSDSEDDNNIKNSLNNSCSGYVGLKNQGTTCYLNSLLQSLFHLPAFRKIVYAMPITGSEDEIESVPLNLQRLFYQMQFSKNPCSTTDLTKSFGWNGDEVYQQQDVEEFLRQLINSLQEKLKGTDLEDSIPNLLCGRYRKTFKCTDVDYQSIKEEDFYDLSMDVKGIPNLVESFKAYVKPEDLVGDNQYDAASFGKQDATMKTEFVKLPPVLHLQLCRFLYDHRKDKLAKINDRFEFPLTIDLTEFLTEDSPDRSRSNVYDLYGVLVHSGTCDSGHYYAFLRTSTSPQWYKFNDSYVSKDTVENAVNKNYGNTFYEEFLGKKENNCNGYILIYVHRDSAESIFEPIKDESIPIHLRQQKDLIKIQFVFDSILKKNSINRINGFFPPLSIKQYNNILYPELSFVHLFDSLMTTFDLFDEISKKVHLNPNQIRLWYCNSDDYPEDIFASSVEILVSDYFQEQREAKMIIQVINEDEQNQEIEGNNKMIVYIKFFFSEKLLRLQQLDESDNLLEKQLQVPLQYLNSVTVNAGDNVECLVSEINKEIGLADGTKLDAYQFEMSGNVKKISLNKSFLSNHISNSSILAFQVNSEEIDKMNSLKIGFSFEFEDRNELFKYDDNSASIHESLKSIENFVKSDYGRCLMKFTEMRSIVSEKQVESKKENNIKIFN